MEEFSKYQARNLYKRSVNMIDKGERTFTGVSFGWSYELLVINALPYLRQQPSQKDYITIKARLTLSPGSRVMLVPIPLVMRGVPAQIFFAVPGGKIW